MKKIFMVIFVGIMCFTLSGCDNNEKTGTKGNNTEITSKYNDSMESLLEGYCKVLKGEEKEDVYLSLFPKEMEEKKKKLYSNKSADGKYNYKDCRYELEYTYSTKELETIEKYANEDNNMALDLKVCHRIKIYDGETYHPDIRACQNSNDKWYLLQE